ncbi:hypothetical protein [Riemerella columbipharyngis]|uniref:Uncharacterized protein n=1 Tax=Riemerella columbipharyngis TaxID=1071918 RepID=A0A1G7A766_9FLAO|nr:hypothetical protein [Riemerella columbipharyngis]SDE10640.1 hypothetical protein SAMN05421544_10377 [Riemerella columbipharyngis]
MEINNIVNGLKHLSEGLFKPEEWINWWEQNDNLVKLFLPPRWYLKIKPKMSQGLVGATLISQNAAREYLKSINQPYNESPHINYAEEYRKQIDLISLEYDKCNLNDFDSKFFRLKQTYPVFFVSMKKHLSKNDIVENNLAEDNLASSYFYRLLHEDVLTFFYCISQLKMENTFIGVNMLELRGEYIKIGELWLNSDGDELYIRPHESAVYFHDIGKNEMYILNNSFYLFVENDLSKFISK